MHDWTAKKGREIALGQKWRRNGKSGQVNCRADAVTAWRLFISFNNIGAETHAFYRATPSVWVRSQAKRTLKSCGKD